jgi:5-(carboxyamino)imidazole ribonucleotide synthase
MAGEENISGILEGFVAFDREISVIVARTADGSAAAYCAVENTHENHILKRTRAPASLPPALAAGADRLARDIAEALGIVGIVCVEMFVTAEDRLLVNELAPRPHNSGHWTIDACPVSQFEQCVRAIAGLPLGSPQRHSDAVMENLLGNDIERWRELAADPAARLHIYGKSEARPGRKMGHVTWIAPAALMGRAATAAEEPR